MDRRDFVQHVTSVAFAGLAGGTLDIDRLCALLDPDPDETRTRQVGTADVEALDG
jgi:hypothetical protein